MPEAIFIDEVYLKENSPLSANIDMAEIYPFAKSAEDRYIHEAIGTSLFNYLTDVVNNLPSPISDNDQTVLDYIKNAMVWYTNYDALPFIWVKLRNIGLVKQAGESMETASESEMQLVRNECKDKAVWYINRLKSYLCANGKLYEQYNKGCWSCGDISPTGVKSHGIDLYFDKNTTPDLELYKKYFTI
jgi:hypothetical protein